MTRLQLSTAVHHLRRLAAPAPADRTDEQLLDAFRQHNDEGAFAVLVRRYSPLVMSVCRRTLGHEQDAEDAFQATFLVLARNCASIRKQGSLAAFLHGVSHRIAMNSRRSMARQRLRDQHGARAEASLPGEDITWREVQALLDEEVEALPEAHRRVFVLCGLQGVSKHEAARQLGLKEGTVSSRLARARRQLQARLQGRGVTLSTLMAALDLTSGGGQVGVATVETTAAWAVAYAAGACLRSAVPARVASLADGVSATMLVSNTRIVTALVLLVGLLAAGAGLLRRPGTQEAIAARAIAAPAEDTKKKAAAQTQVEVRGRVVGPDGKAIRGVKVEARLQSSGRPDGATRAGTATTTADGRFVLSFKKGPSDSVVVTATAAGFGLDWADTLPTKGEEMTLKLVKDQPITALVLGLEGQKVKDARLSVVRIEAPATATLAEHFAEEEMGKFRSRRLAAWALPEALRTATTDASGRLRLAGLGQERKIVVVLEGSSIASTEAWVLTRPQRLTTWQKVIPVYAADFRHLAAPARPVAGVVRDRATKKPLAGLTVRSEKLANQFWWGSRYVVTRTDAAGRFRLVGLPKGKGNWIVVEPPADQPYLGVQIEVPDPVGGEPVPVDADLPRGVWAEGQVTDDSTRRPVPGVKVRYLPGPGNPNVSLPGQRGHLYMREVSASSSGRYRLAVPQGKGMLAVQAGREFLPLSEQEPLKGDQTAARSELSLGHYHRLVDIEPAKDAEQIHCDVALSKGEKIQGKLLDPDGKEVKGAWAWGLGHAWEGWRGPLESSRFTLAGFNPKQARYVAFVHPERNLAGVLPLWADRVGRDPRRPAMKQLARLFPADENNGQLVVKLQTAGTLTAQIVDADGKPRPGVMLQVYLATRLDPTSHHPGAVKTDADGRVRLPGLIPGMKYVIQRLNAEEVLGWYTLGVGQTKDLGAVKLRRPGR
jgi:RNA polymerase sigma factor (sigma-70 family)